LGEILGRSGNLRAIPAIDGEPIPYGEVRVARPDYHLLLERDRVIVAQGPKENRSRPSIDTLFRSASLAFRTRVIGVVLTGNLDDGTAGLWSIKRAGGIAIVQDPMDAEYPDMPKNAKDAVRIDHCVPISELASLLTKLTTFPAPENAMTIEEDHEVPGVVYVCPDCNGPLREVKTGNEKLVRFRCLVGHAFSMMTLLEGHAEAREAALWTAVVSLEHEAMFAERAAKQALSRNDSEADVALSAEAVRAREQSGVIRGLLRSSPSRRVGDPA
jgi:two-component system, chemotaxis family, protein-glutamate methylesterase/glutaminase